MLSVCVMCILFICDLFVLLLFINVMLSVVAIFSSLEKLPHHSGVITMKAEIQHWVNATAEWHMEFCLILFPMY